MTRKPNSYDPVVRMNRHGIRSGIFQCVVERGRSAIGDEWGVSELASEGNIIGTIKCPGEAFPVVGDLRFRKDVECGAREVPAI